MAENLLGYSSGPLFFDTFCSVYIDACVIYLVWLACTASTLFSAYNFIACTAAPPLKLQMDPPVFFEVRGGCTKASNSSVLTEQKTGETEIE